MTHTLHRVGDRESLRNDYVILAMPVKGVNKEGSREKLLQILDIGLKNGAVNAGDTQQGNIYSIGTEGLRRQLVDGGVLNMVFTREEDVINTLKGIRELNNGMSVVVTGLLEYTKECCEKAGLERHTVARSLGVWGKTELLPARNELEIMTMCGHGLITAALIYDVADRVKKGQLTIEQAGVEIAKPCICGACNPIRASELIKKFL
ncbi:MAG: hypothetical protein VB092_05085 [Oscillospiraceae bacterium]|nr:hypothetical protein [Oscillospiraceae bacterium]